MNQTYTNVDEYISTFPEDRQKLMQEFRKVIKDTVPNTIEKISWSMPTYVLYKNLVHFAMHKNHIGFYPGEEAIRHFEAELGDFNYSKGAIQFPIDKPMPYDLIKKITLFRVEEDTKGYLNCKKK